MVYDFSELKKKLPEIKNWLKAELSLLRTGRVSPTLLDGIHPNYYGTNTPLNHIAAISTEDARTLRVKPWDTTMIHQIEAEIRSSGLGLSPIAEKDSLRVVFPDLTEERRKALLKIVGEKLEHARISLRQLRDEYWGDIQNEERESRISEDTKYRGKDELQKMINEMNKEFGGMAEAKEKEIQS